MAENGLGSLAGDHISDERQQATEPVSGQKSQDVIHLGPPTANSFSEIAIGNERLQTHNEFVSRREKTILESAQQVLGKGLLAAGTIVALEGIGHFILGQSPTEIIFSHIKLENFPQAIKEISQNLADLDVVIKTGSGAAMMRVGAKVFDSASIKNNQNEQS